MKMLQLLANIVKPELMSLWMDFVLPKSSSQIVVSNPCFVQSGYSMQIIDGGSEIVNAIGHQLLIKFYTAHSKVFDLR
jgi:hypothetical protein